MYCNTFVLIKVYAIANFSLWRYTKHNIIDLFELCIQALTHTHTHTYRESIIGWLWLAKINEWILHMNSNPPWRPNVI